MFKSSLTNIGSATAQKLLQLYYRRAGRIFIGPLSQLKQNQEQILHRILTDISASKRGDTLGVKEDWSYQEFSKLVPLSSYQDYEKFIEEQMSSDQVILCGDIQKFQPTSGSTHQRKWIPYNKALLHEFDQAITPWLAGIYQDFPEVATGRHYWSLSWMPDELRQSMATNDDLEYFPWWKRVFMSLTMAVPPDLAKVKTSEASLIATLVYLCCCRNLSLISIWSPTYLLSLLRRLKEEKTSISEVIARGEWGKWNSQMNQLPCPKDSNVSHLLKNWDGELKAEFMEKLWPELKLVSAWDTAMAKPWAEEIRTLFPHASFQGKGLFATEAVVTIPYKQKYILSYQSHFYEFQKESDNKIVPSWELVVGDIVMPIVTAGNGFLRYQIQDRLVVDSIEGSVPCLTFLGRLRGSDMVGEKLTSEVADDLLKDLSKLGPALIPVSLLAITPKSESPYYLALIQSEELIPSGQVKVLELRGEAVLRQHFHYGVARDLGQLSGLQVRISSAAFKEYQDVAVKKGMIAGDLKVEPLLVAGEHWDHDGKSST